MWAAGTMQCCQQILFQAHNRIQILLLVFALHALHVNGSSDADAEMDTCSPRVRTPGITVPKGDILIKYGNPLEIFCKLHENETSVYNVSDLFFSSNSKVVSSNYTNIVNRTTLRLYIPKPPPSNTMYHCNVRDPSKGIGSEVAVCLNQVYVGVPPQNVENFTCISRNWENLTCTWNVPNNFVPTTYRLLCYLAGSGPRRSKCPNDTDVKLNYCFWSSETIPHYRSVQKNYMFTIVANNTFGVESFEHTINHWAYIIPAKPKGLTVAETTSYSALLNWSVLYPMDNFQDGLFVKIEYRSVHDQNNTWMLADTANLTVWKFASFNLTGLKYAHTGYEARVYMKSSYAVGDSYWSQPATMFIKTKPTIPGAPPKTDIGSFEISRESGRHVYVYWQYIDNLLENGESFAYKVIDVKENGVSKQMSPVNVTKAYAKFEGISASSSYSFTIVSSNVIGRSVESSKVYVPSEAEIPPQPISFTKIAFQNRTFELSWEPPPNTALINDYTIFWCENGQDRPYQCIGFLDWVHVPKSKTEWLLRVPKSGTYQIAIAANSKTASSGMLWASCTVLHNQNVSKMKTVLVVNANATFIELVWNLDCSERIGTVKGYRVYYCPILSPDNTTCKGEEKSDMVEDVPQVRGNYVVRNVKPYTTYRISMAVISSKLVEGPRSDYLFATTTESAPEPVKEINISKVTNVSMVVSWIPPVNKNGMIKYYEVTYGGHSKKVEGNETTLNDLTPFMNYTVGIAACTVNCSKVTNIDAKTKIGNPSKIDTPKVTLTNTSLAIVTWDPPLLRGGPLDTYTIRFTTEHGTFLDYINTTETMWEQPINCANEGWGQKYLFSVRAVNRDGETWYVGPWSPNGEGNCVTLGMSESLIVFISLCGIMAMVAGCFGAFYAARRVWGHYNEMRHVKVTLPPGLASVNVYCPTSYTY